MQRDNAWNGKKRDGKLGSGDGKGEGNRTVGCLALLFGIDGYINEIKQSSFCFYSVPPPNESVSGSRMFPNHSLVHVACSK